MRRTNKFLTILLVALMAMAMMLPACVFADSARLSGTWSVSDIRTGETHTISASSGKPMVVIFGSYATCLNTKKTLNMFSDLMNGGDISSDSLDVYYFPVRSDYDDGVDIASLYAPLNSGLILADVKANGQHVYAGEYSSPYRNLFSNCATFAGINGSFTMPLVVYFDGTGAVTESSTGSKTEEFIRGAIASTGADIYIPTYLNATVDVEVTRDYTSAYEIFDELNQYRIDNGLAPLTMDPDLLEAAMSRGAEITVRYEHDRPNGDVCFSICPDKMDGENIAYGYPTSGSVMDAWKKSPGHNANMLTADFQSVGIGAVEYDGICYWVQCFGTGTSSNDTASRNLGEVDRTVKVPVSAQYVQFYFEYSYAQVYNNEMVPNVVIGDYYVDFIPEATYVISDPSVGYVDETGHIIGLRNGEAVLQLTFEGEVLAVCTIEIVGNIGGATPTPTVAVTATNTPMPTAIATPTSVALPTATNAPTVTPTNVPTVTPTSVPTVTPTDVPGITPTPEIGGVEGFIARLYSEVLGREADEGGINYWVDQLNNGTTGGDAAKFFLCSEEFLNKAMSNEEFVRVLYAVFFDRTPDAGGLNYWMSEVTGKGKTAVIDSLIESQEWANICESYGIATGAGSSSSDPIVAFAERLYTTCLGRSGEQGGIDFWSAELRAGRYGGSDAARGFFFGAEFTNANHGNTEFVTRLYRTFFNREPDADGMNFWLGELGKGISREAAFVAFTACQEWLDTCSRAGIQP